MRARRSAWMAILFVAGCAGPLREVEPAGLAYACADGKQAVIFYAGGGYFPRATARLQYEGREFRLTAVPPTYGLRYVSDGAGNTPIMIWSARAEDAWLTELDPGQSEEREIAHCTRVRG